MLPRRFCHGRIVSHPYRGRGSPTARVQPSSSATQASFTSVAGGGWPSVSRLSDLSMEEFVYLVGCPMEHDYHDSSDNCWLRPVICQLFRGSIIHTFCLCSRAGNDHYYNLCSGSIVFSAFDSQYWWQVSLVLYTVLGSLPTQTEISEFDFTACIATIGALLN